MKTSITSLIVQFFNNLKTKKEKKTREDGVHYEETCVKEEETLRMGRLRLGPLIHHR